MLIQAPYPENGANLPNGLYILDTYTELEPGSHNMSVFIHNGTAKAIHMSGGRQIARVMTINSVSDADGSQELMTKLEEEDPQL